MTASHRWSHRDHREDPHREAIRLRDHFAGPYLEQIWFDVSNLSFRNLRFSLRNARGAVFPLHGAHLSIHLIFD